MEPAACEPQTRVDIFWFEIPHLFDDFFDSEPVRQEIQYVAHPNAHTSDTGAPGALLCVYRDAIRKLGHGLDETAETSNAFTTQTRSLLIGRESRVPDSGPYVLGFRTRVCLKDLLRRLSRHQKTQQP
jgi:hypothetical protein